MEPTLADVLNLNWWMTSRMLGATVLAILAAFVLRAMLELLRL